MIGLAYNSPAKISIIPMQDVLSLGSEARMNLPSSVKGNWTWRLRLSDKYADNADWLKELLEGAGRIF
jgi:4-alpha-glucanotransferase